MRSWHLGTAASNFISMSVPPTAAMASRKAWCIHTRSRAANAAEIVRSSPSMKFSRKRMDATDKELREERDGVKG
jgi:malate dehydrogenase